MGTRRGHSDAARDEAMRGEGTRRGGDRRGPARETGAQRGPRRACAAASEGDGSKRSGGMGL